MAVRQPITEQDKFFELMSGDRFVLWPAQRRVRALYNGVIIADSEAAELSIEVRDYHRRADDLRNNVFWMGHSFYGWPLRDIKAEHFLRTDEKRTDARIGEGTWYDIRVGNRQIKRSAWSWDAPNADHPELAKLIFINSLALDALIEEEDEIAGPRNPFHSVEIRNSSRHIRIVLDGVEIANSHQPRLLFETGLPVRYYLPKQDVRMDLLTPNEITSGCPYKGEAVYWDVHVNGRTHVGVVWSYVHPYPNAVKIEHLLGFYEERGLTIYVDGVERQQYQPATLKEGFLTKPLEDPVEGAAPTAGPVKVETLPEPTCACDLP
jgi:uncharacterized protein (DUF427 family)